MQREAYAKRRLRVCYLNLEEKVVDVHRLALEKKLRLLGELQLEPVQGLADPRLLPCDLLVVAASKVPSSELPNWLERFRSKIQQQGQIWIPALIIADTNFASLQTLWEKAVQMNWYFDMMREEHLDSLPIRVANLLRIHDHLHELKRYEDTLNALSRQLEQLSSAIRVLKNES